MHANPQDKHQDKANKKFMKNIEPGKEGNAGQNQARSSEELEWDSLEKLKRIENS